MASDSNTNIFLYAKDRTSEGLKKAKQSFEKFRKSAKGSLDSIGVSSKVASLSIVGAMTLTGVAMARAVGEMDAVAKSARRLRIEASQFAAWQVIAEDAGTSAETMAKSVRKAEQSMLEASRGSKIYVDALEYMDITFTDVNGKLLAGEELVAKIGDGYLKAADPVKYMATAQQLLGRNVAQLIPLWESGSANIAVYSKQLKDAGAVQDDALYLEAEKLSSQWTRLGSIFGGVWDKVAISVASVFAGAFTEIGGWTSVLANTSWQKWSDLFFDPWVLAWRAVNVAANGLALDSTYNELNKVNKQIDLFKEGLQNAKTPEAIALQTRMLAEQEGKAKGLKEEIYKLKGGLEGADEAWRGARRNSELLTKEYNENYNAGTKLVGGGRDLQAQLKGVAAGAKEAGDAECESNKKVKKCKDATKKAEDKKQDTVLRGVGIAMDASNALTAIAGEEFENNKKTQIAMGIANTAAAAITTMRTDAQWGGPWAIASGALVAAAGLAQVANIRNTTIGGGGSATPSQSSAPAPVQETRINSNINLFAGGGIGADNADEIASSVRSELAQEFNR